MPDFFSRLITRSKRSLQAIRPLTAPMFAQGPAVALEKSFYPPEEENFEGPRSFGRPIEPQQSRNREQQSLEPEKIPDSFFANKIAGPARPAPYVKNTLEFFDTTPSQQASPPNLPAFLETPQQTTDAHFAEAHSMPKAGVADPSRLANWDGAGSTDPVTLQATTGVSNQELRPIRGQPAQVRLADTRLNRTARKPAPPGLSPISHHESGQNDGLKEPSLEPRESRTIRVTIGRVDVRAITPSKEPPTRAKGTSKPLAVPLDEYLKQRKAGQR